MAKNPYDKVIKEMKKKISASYKKFTQNISKKAPLKTLQKDSAELMMLLGEVNYLVKECERMHKKTTKK